MSNPFDDKVVAITGAGKGLGRAYALYFATLGASVVVNNRRHEGESESSADRVVAEIVGNGGSAVAEYSSVEDGQAGDNLLTVALNNFGRLDCLVANAGVSEGAPFRKQALDDFRRVMEINLMGTVNVVHPVFRYMCEAAGGTIVISTSSAGLFGEFGLPAYSTSKAAVIGLMRSLSLEGVPKSVHVNAISPYATTQMTADHLPAQIASQLEPEHVAPVVAWLASGSITGEIVIAGGGQAARARLKTSSPVAVSANDAAGWRTLLASDACLEFGSAGRQFEDFAASLVTTNAT